MSSYSTLIKANMLISTYDDQFGNVLVLSELAGIIGVEWRQLESLFDGLSEGKDKVEKTVRGITSTVEVLSPSTLAFSFQRWGHADHAIAASPLMSGRRRLFLQEQRAPARPGTRAFTTRNDFKRRAYWKTRTDNQRKSSSRALRYRSMTWHGW